MASTPIERIEAFCRDKDIGSLSELGRLIGASAGTFSIIKKRDRPPGTKVMQLLTSKYPDLSSDWVLYGRGPMYLNDQRLTSTAQLPPPVPSELNPEKHKLPTPGQATPQEADFVGRLLRQYEEQIAGYQEREAQWEAREAWYQEMLKKPLASSDAAAPMFIEPATPISLRPTACLPVSAAVQSPMTAECVVREMWPKQEQQILVA